VGNGCDPKEAKKVVVEGEEKVEEEIQLEGADGDLADTADVEEQEPEKGSWEDWALCLGAEIMAELRAEVWKQLHYTCSAVNCFLRRLYNSLLMQNRV
jgi:hypothetical protein